MANNDIRVNLEVTGEQKTTRALKNTGDAAEKAGDDLREMGEDAEFLTKEAIEASAALKALVRELNRTGDTSLKKDIRAERKRLREAQGLLKDLVPEVAPVAAKAGASFGETFTTTASTAIARGGPYVTAAAAALAASAAPLVGSTIAAAVLGGVGAGGIVGGIALAADDPRIQSAGKQVAESILGDLSQSADSFVAPLLTSLAKLQTAGSGWAAKLEPAFDDLADSIDPLTEGLTRAGDVLIPGLTAAAEGAGPVLATLADEIPEISSAFSRMLTIIASDPQGAQDAIETLGNLLEATFILTGYLVSGLTKVHEKAADVGEALGLVERVKVDERLKSDADALDLFGKSAEEAAEETKSLGAAIDELFGRTLGVQEATLAYEQAVDDLMTELTDGKRTLDENTQAGRDNWDAINDQARAINDLREANIRNKVPLADANKLYEQQFEQLRKTLLNLGYNKTAVNEYIDRLKNIPKSVRTTVLIDAFANNAALLALAGAGKVAGKRAAGGPVIEGQSYIVGENGPELVRFGASGTVYSANQTKAMFGASGTASAPAAVDINVRWAGPGGPAGDLGEALAKWLRFDVKWRGGGSVEAAYGEH